ncbi:metal ABC transporter permease [Orbaceae bacterium ac157xtp]
MSVVDFLLEPFYYGFILQALFAAVLTGLVCAIFSCFLVLKGWSLMGDAISHAVLPGIIGAFVLGIPLIIGAFASGLFCALATGYVKNHCRVKEDTVMGIIFSGMFALGLVLFSKIDTDQHLSHILFGNILGIRKAELIQIVIIASVVSLIMLLKRKDIFLYCFDPTQAKIVGLPVQFIHYGLLSLLALTIVASLQAAGVILVIAMLIAPGITAFILTQRFSRMLIIAICVSISASVFGTLISFYIDAATGPCIVILQALIFVCAQTYVFCKKRRIQTQSLQTI